MTAREKIQNLTNAWYGYFAAAGLVSVVRAGFGIFSIVITVFATLGLFLMTWFIGKRLLAKSSFTRIALVITSFLVAAMSGYGVAKGTWMFIHDWSFSLLIGILLGAGSAMMHVRSFRVLTDSSVKAYIES